LRVHTGLVNYTLPAMSTCDITVVIPTFNRPQQLLQALDKICACSPAPAEVIVHIDANDSITETALLNSTFKMVKIIRSDKPVGPGGGRNRAIASASHNLVASFDDDSYPIDPDYFTRLLQLFEQFPRAAVIGAAIYHIDEPVHPDEAIAQWKPNFVGCGCAYRRDVFLQTNGYVELPVAYGMEEVDLSLRLHHQEWGILSSPWLRVFHNTRLEHHSQPQVTAASIANLALLAYLRYPVPFWWLGIVQCANRILWLIKNGRFAGILRGVFTIPKLIYRHRRQRQPISVAALKKHLQFIKTEMPAVSIPKVSSSSMAGNLKILI
jgi:GT2 family glycosyltransferase